MDPPHPFLHIQQGKGGNTMSLDGVNIALSTRAVHTSGEDAASTVDEQSGGLNVGSMEMAPRLEMQYDACASWWTQARNSFTGPCNPLMIFGLLVWAISKLPSMNTCSSQDELQASSAFTER